MSDATGKAPLPPDEKTRAYDQAAASANRTTAYDSGSAEAPKTGVYAPGSQDHNATSAYGASRPASEGKSRHGVEQGQELLLGERTLRVERFLSVGTTGEADVYLVSDSDGRRLALKLYVEFSSARAEPNEQALARIMQLDDPDVVKLIDYGVGDRKYLGKYCYELEAFAEGGDLLSVGNVREKYTPQFVKHVVVPQIARGLSILHAQQIFHCDLKPRNVFWLDKKQTDLVIGDYGSARTRDLESRTDVHAVSRVMATNEYMAPELHRGAVSEKVDYYSLGMVVLELLYPDKFPRAPGAGWKRFIERQESGREVLDFDPSLTELNDLISGLTLRDHKARWGSAEVTAWMKGQRPKVEFGSAAAHETQVKPINLGGTVLRNEEDLAHYVETDRGWHNILLEDKAGRKAMLEMIDQARGIRPRKTCERLLKTCEQYGVATVTQALLLFLQPRRAVIVDGIPFNLWDAGKLRDTLGRALEQAGSLAALGQENDARAVLVQLEVSLPQVSRSDEPALAGQATAVLREIDAVLGCREKTDESDALVWQRVLVPSDAELLVGVVLPRAPIVIDGVFEIVFGPGVDPTSAVTTALVDADNAVARSRGDIAASASLPVTYRRAVLRLEGALKVLASGTVSPEPTSQIIRLISDHVPAEARGSSFKPWADALTPNSLHGLASALAGVSTFQVEPDGSPESRWQPLSDDLAEITAWYLRSRPPAESPNQAGERAQFFKRGEKKTLGGLGLGQFLTAVLRECMSLSFRVTKFARKRDGSFVLNLEIHAETTELLRKATGPWPKAFTLEGQLTDPSHFARDASHLVDEQFAKAIGVDPATEWREQSASVLQSALERTPQPQSIDLRRAGIWLVAIAVVLISLTYKLGKMTDEAKEQAAKSAAAAAAAASPPTVTIESLAVEMGKGAYTWNTEVAGRQYCVRGTVAKSGRTSSGMKAAYKFTTTNDWFNINLRNQGDEAQLARRVGQDAVACCVVGRATEKLSFTLTECSLR